MTIQFFTDTYFSLYCYWYSNWKYMSRGTPPKAPQTSVKYGESVLLIPPTCSTSQNMLQIPHLVLQRGIFLRCTTSTHLARWNDPLQSDPLFILNQIKKKMTWTDLTEKLHLPQRFLLGCFMVPLYQSFGVWPPVLFSSRVPSVISMDLPPASSTL